MPNMYQFGLVLLISLQAIFAKHEFYDGHALFEIKVSGYEQSKKVNDIEIALDLDVLKHASTAGPGSVIVPPTKRLEFTEKLQEIGAEYRVAVESIKNLLDQEDEWIAASNKTKAGQGRITFDTFHRYEEVDAYLVEVARQYPDVVTLVSGGESVEGRDIKYLKISTTNFEDTSKPVVFIESLVHAREWITLPATLYAIRKLVEDVTETDLVENVDWIVLPMVNPDGYEFSHTGQRLWRKNRQEGLLCAGVDLNRNFDFFWSTESSSFGCSDTYHGSAPFSEPETSIVRNIITEHLDRLELFIDVHSFGSFILYGYSNSGQLPPNGLFVHLVGIQMAEAIDAASIPINPQYVVGNTMHILYAASGGASDYAQLTGVPFSYTYELPAFDNPLIGFIVNPDYIPQAAFETWEGIKAGARYAMTSYTQRKNQ